MSLLTAITALVSVALLVFILVLVYRENRLLFWCMLASPCLLVAAAISVYGMNVVLVALGIIKPESAKDKEIRVAVALRQEKEPEKPPPPPPAPEPPKPEYMPKPEPEKPKPIEEMALPKGRADGDPTAKTMPKGKNTDGKRVGTSGDPSKPAGEAPNNQVPTNANDRTSSEAPTKVVTTTGEGNISVPNVDKMGGGSIFSQGDGLSGDDVKGFGNKKVGSGTGDGEGGGEGGDDYGDPDGSGKKIPRGFENGTANGRLYFVRLKHGSGAWNAHSEGLRRLLMFINDKNIMKAESDSRPMSTEEMKSKYMRHGKQPTFLYLYVDASFKLSGTEVAILREYIRKGGFLFLDSRPDPEIRPKVQSELSKVFPGMRLAAISSGHLINRFMFRLNEPGVGQNFSEQRNYGITSDRRLVAFYSPGNFAALFAAHSPNEAEYMMAQYQMVVNVIFYANTRGNQKFETRAGANAKVTTQQLEKLGFIDRPAAGKPPQPGATPTSVKVKRTPRPQATPGVEPEPEPDDIDILN